MIGGDTVVVVHIKQIRYLNVHFAQFDECKAVNQDLWNAVHLKEEAEKKQAQAVKALQDAVDAQAGALRNKDVIIDTQKHELRKQKLKKGLAFVAAAVFAGVAIPK